MGVSESSSAVIFAAEVVGTFGLLVAATGSIVYDGSVGSVLGLPFIAAMHFVGLFIVVFIFGRYSMAHFNPAVTIGFALSGHIRKERIPLYLAAQAIGAVSGSLFVKYTIGEHASLGLNSPDYMYGAPLVFGTEVAATVFLMGGILLIVSLRMAHAAVVASVVGGIVALDVLFLAPISGASMNPIRSLSPAIVTGIFDNIWLYLTAPLVGAAVTAAIYKRVRAISRASR